MDGTFAQTFNVLVSPEGRIEVDVPFPPGQKVTVLVVPTTDDLTWDLMQAAESSTGFWNNPLDDEDWNNA